MTQNMTPLSKYITNGEIYICDLDWEKLNEKYEREELMKFFTEEIVSKNISIPYRKIEYDDMKESFLKLCNNNSGELKIGNTYTAYDYKYHISNYYFDGSAEESLCSDYFQQQNRFKVDGVGYPSPERTWNNDKFLQGYLKSLWTLKQKHIDTRVLRQCLSLRKYIASQFKPSVAKAIYEYFGTNDTLDFSSGWGDRLAGFYAAEGTKTYIGCDPNTVLFPKYEEEIKEFSKYYPNKKAIMLCSPAEDVMVGADTVDTVFTSPPYFDSERYSEEQTQSYIKFKDFDDWVVNFLFKSIDMAWNALKKGGVMIINLADVYHRKTLYQMCDVMNDHIKMLGGTYENGYGLKIAKRPKRASVEFKDGVFVEPIWVWKK